MSENSTIAALVLGCKQNNRNSQKELYYLFRSYAMSICYRYAHRVEDAEELVNESFIKLFKHIEQFDEERKEDLTMARESNQNFIRRFNVMMGCLYNADTILIR